MLKLVPRWALTSLIAAAGMIVLLAFVLPASLRWYIEKNSQSLTGRQINIGSIRLNPLTGSVSINGFVMHERDSAAPFVSFDRLYVNTSVWPTLFGTPTIEAVTLDHPVVYIRQKGNQFNFDDLVIRFASDTTAVDTTTEASPFHAFSLQLNDGALHYTNADLPSAVSLVKLNGLCPKFSTTDPLADLTFSGALASGGTTRGRLRYDGAAQRYAAQYTVDSVALQVLQPYVRAYMNVGTFEGLLSAQHEISGSTAATNDFAMKGVTTVKNFLLRDEHEPLFSFGELAGEVDTLHTLKELYDLKYVRMVQPYLKFELYPDGTNFDKLMTSGTTSGPSTDSLSTAVAYGNIFALMAAYIKEMTHDYAISSYKIDSLALDKGTFIFNDYTLQSKFNYVLEDLRVSADRVNSTGKLITLKAACTLNQSGKMDGEIQVNPDGFQDMDIRYTIDGLKVTDFNPYSNYYVATPFLSGTGHYSSQTSIRNMKLKSDHKMEIRTIAAGKKVKNKTAYNLPVRLAVALLRDKNGDIKLDIPIEGDLNDPKYKVGKVIWQVVTNLIKKAAAAPGKLLSGKAGVSEKDLQGFAWKPLQTQLDENQMRSMQSLQKALAAAPEMKAALVVKSNLEKETDELALRRSKQKYLFFHRKISSEEEVAPDEAGLIDQVDHSDSTLRNYLDQQLQIRDEKASVFEKARRLVGGDKVKKDYEKLLASRDEAVRAYLLSLGIPPERYTITYADAAEGMPYEDPSSVRYDFVLADETDKP